MIQTHSEDPDVAAAAHTALELIDTTLKSLPAASEFDYGGHMLKLGEYDVCTTCTKPIAEAQAAERALRDQLEKTDDQIIREHLELAVTFFHAEAAAAEVRAELHNGHNTEAIIDRLLGYQFERGIHDDYQHNHHTGQNG